MAMPVYAMSVFKLPKSTCKNLTSAMSSFWWNVQEGKNKIHWVAWEKLCLSKDQGGMGFRDIEKFNQALLAKQGWRLLMYPDSLCAQFLCSRYYPNGNFMEAPLGSRPSYAWRSIMFGRQLLEKGLRRSIGDGEGTNVWRDKWLFKEAPCAPFRKSILFDLDLRVCDLLDPQTKTWDRDKLEENFFPPDIALILKQKPVVAEKDCFEWVHTHWGGYTVKSGYWLACKLEDSEVRRQNAMQPSTHGLFQKVWKVKTAPKIRIFMWKALSNALSVNDGLLARGLKIDPRCQRCGEEGESINHVLFACPSARVVWAQSNFPFPRRGFEHMSLLENFNHLLSLPKNLKVPEDIARLFPWVLWILWKNRNSFVFEGKEFSVEDTVAKIWEDCNHWFEAQEKVEEEAQLDRQVESCRSKWEAPVEGELKCNVALKWSKNSQCLGASWIVKNCRGEALLHSRRTFGNIGSFLDAKLTAWMWAIESMRSHHVERIVFEVEFSDLIGAVKKQSEWPALRYQGSELRKALGDLEGWSCRVISQSANRCAGAIAKSATQARWSQSYVSQGNPRWLDDLFEADKRRS